METRPDKAESWTLLTVSYGGEVKYTPGFSTLRLCREAKSLALTGMTIEENERADAEYLSSPPPPEPSVRDRVYSSPCRFSEAFDPNLGEAAVRVRGRWLKKYAKDIKVAECIPDVEA